MKRILYLFAFCFSLGVTASFGQEICANGIDDDLDGFIDCFDGECAKNIVCTGGFVGNDLLCEAKPTEFDKFSMTLESASPDGTAVHLGRVVVGDLDRDGVPEMVTTNTFSKKIFILNGDNTAGVNTIQLQLSVAYNPAYEDILIGNIDNDNCAEIFVLGNIRDAKGAVSNWTIYAYDCGLNALWSRPIKGDPGMMGLADFNGDGKVELYARNAIFNAHTGAVIVPAGGGWAGSNGGPVAVDILNDVTKNVHLLTDAVKDDGLELVSGGTIYSVNIAAGTIKAEKTIPNYKQNTGADATSIADFNLDGSLDVIASGANTNLPLNPSSGKNTNVFFWDVKTNAVLTYTDTISAPTTIASCNTSTGTYYKYGWHQGTGRLNVADLDGDGKLNVAYVSGKYLYALKEDFTPLWPKLVVNEETSGNTGCTLFDFNGDGLSEVVYRDEKFIYIINGKTGVPFPGSQQTCVSRTNREYPIVADVDGDGNTELCVTCRTTNFFPSGDMANFCDINKSEFSQVRVYRSNGTPWVPARRVWNQHGYFNVNVNDNLSIPKIQQKHHLVFSSNVCTVGANRPLNSFLNQSPYLNSLGCPKYASPDLAYVPNSLTINPPTCPDGNFTITFKITNLGDVDLSGNVPITFYNGDPKLVGAVKLNTINVNLKGFGVNDVQTINNATVNGPGLAFTLYIVLNDNGTTVPTPIKLPNTNFIECNYDNNILSAPVVPLPSAITAVKVQDNIKCSPPGNTPDNGAVRAYILKGATENTTDYTFYWFNGTVAKPPASADFVGAVYTGRAAGTFTVYAIHKSGNCSSDTAQVTIQLINRNLTAKINLLSPYTNCVTPNGSLKVIMNDTDGDGVGEDPNNFTYTWYEGNDIFTSPQVGINSTVTGLKPLSYTVLVKDKTSGCQIIESLTVPDQTVIPVVTVTKVDATCSTPTGSVSANVGGSTTGFTFKWYKGTAVKPAPDFTGAVYTNRAPGDYTVVAVTASQCSSAPVTETIIQTASPVVSVTLVSDQTSCDPTLPTGSASAAVSGSTSGFNFEWFKGQNTLAANRVSTSSIATGLATGIYTVKATSIATGCSGIAEIAINFAVVTPVLTLASSTNSTQCVPFNGTITIAVSPDTPADYTFSWYKGTSVKATTDFADTDEVLTGLPAGDYTVIGVDNLRHCETAPLTVTLIDASPVTVFNRTNVVRPSTCNDNNGSMTIGVSAPGNVAGFDFEWRKGQDPFLEPAITTTTNTNFTTTASALQTGVYTLIATNRETGCVSSQIFDLPFDDAQILSFDSKADIETCLTDNNAFIQVLLTPTAGFPPADYNIEVFKGKNDLGAAGIKLATIVGVNPTLLYKIFSTPGNNLDPGFYTFVAVTTNPARSTFNCRSVPVTAEIKKITQNPVFTAASFMQNTNCGGAPGTGQITLTLQTPTNNPNNYNFEWFEGADTSAPVLGTGTSGVEAGVNGEVVSGLPAGKYTVRVTNSGVASPGCFSTATYQIFDNPPILILNAADAPPVSITRCDVTTADLTVTQVHENNVVVPFANYDFEWYRDTPTGPQLIPGETGHILANQPVGKYYVRPINKVSLCSTGDLVALEIMDKTMNTVAVSLANFTTPTQCLKPTNITGQLEVIASGTSVSGYTYTWHTGQTTAGPVLPGANVGGANGEIAQNLTTGFYTVDVLNNTTQCRITDTYEVPIEKQPITIAASTQPLTVCLVTPKDGGVFATVTSGSKNDYTYNWYNGTVKATPDFTGTANAPVTDLNAGTYIVIAIDNLDAGCTVSDTVTVDDARTPPVVLATVLNPLTICDPARPDGVASASVDGDVIYHTFDWYTGAPPSGTPFYTGAEVGSLAQGTFSVIATDVITGCSDTTQVAIDLKNLPIPVPQIEILSMVTSCVDDNGALAVSVNGNTADYIFNWYIGIQEKNSPDFVGEIYDSLAIGFYGATATSRITGCKSPITTEQILADPIYPDFTFTTTAAMCKRDATDQATGLAAIFITNDVSIGKIEWNVNGSIVTGPILSGVDAGTYQVTVTSELGCPVTKDVTIKTEIHPYNGISRSKDGQNDIFFINCIESFPMNDVKIFNRAGTLVYEAQGYDNNGTFFDGQSNKGISLMGTNLPGGTYFYIIDKHDGTKPLAGYLELVN